MNSLIRPRTSSPHSPPIRHARSLSPRSVMVEYEFPDEDGEGAQELQHLQQPLPVNLDYDYYFRDCSLGANKNNTTRRPLARSGSRNSIRINKRKLLSADLPPRGVTNLKHRQVSIDTMEWLSSCSSNSTSATNTRAVSDTDDNDESFASQLSPALTSSARKKKKNSLIGAVREPVEELWLGPVFESSQTVLTAIASLPTSVNRLNLDLRNALHLLPQAMPLLFGNHHLKRLSLRVHGDAGAVELAKWMNHNPNLEHLDLRGNRIGSMGARTIVDAIMASSDSNSGSDGNRSHHNLSHLNLSSNCILHGDMIGELLAGNAALEVLDLGFNWLGNQEVEDICIGLCKNTSLRELNLYGCHRISHTGMNIILRCLQKHNTSLHKIGLQAFDEEGKQLIEEINYWLKLNKAGRYLIKSYMESSSVSSEQGNQTNDPPLCHNSHREPAPMGLWPHALVKSNKDPDSIFHLVREGFGARIMNHR